MFTKRQIGYRFTNGLRWNYAKNLKDACPVYCVCNWVYTQIRKDRTLELHRENHVRSGWRSVTESTTSKEKHREREVIPESS